MKIALISDIHGNLEALEAVLREIDSQRFDQIHCLGDVIGYGCDPVACLRLVEQHCDIKLMGNHEYAVIGLVPLDSMNRFARDSIVWTQAQLGDREISMIAEFDMAGEVADSYLVHASPYEPDEWHYVMSEREAERGFSSFKHRLGFYGHTHIPMTFCLTPTGRLRMTLGHDFDPDEECRYLINIGSVGQPRDEDPRACFVIYDSEEDSVYYQRVEYDIKAAQAKMAKANLPEMLIERLGIGK